MDTRHKVINKQRSFTLTALTKLINSKYKKGSGAEFTCSDVKKYVMRGHLPAYMGGYAARECSVDETGIKYVEILDPVGIRGKSASCKGLFD